MHTSLLSHAVGDTDCERMAGYGVPFVGIDLTGDSVSGAADAAERLYEPVECHGESRYYG
jgi:hypothetical protein